MTSRFVAASVLVSALALLGSGCATVRDPRAAALAKAQRFHDAGRYAKALQATELAGASASPDPAVTAAAFQVNEDGQATQIRVPSAPHPLLGGAAIDAISRGRIDPTLLGLTDRSALPALRQTKINFELE